jgi:hypothetical protein
MYIVVMHKHSFNQYEYLARSISLSDAGIYTITDTGGGTHTFAKADYLIAIMG